MDHCDFAFIDSVDLHDVALSGFAYGYDGVGTFDTLLHYQHIPVARL